MSSLRQHVARFLFAPLSGDSDLDKAQRRDRLICIGLLFLISLFALWLRVCGLALHHYSGDDCLHIETARLPSVGMILEDVWKHDTHPPLYYLVLHFFFLWIPLSSPIVAKIPSILFGVALVPASYVLGRTVCGSRAPGLLLAILIAVSGQIALQAQTVRHYSLHLILQLVLLSAFFMPKARRSALYFVTAALLICTHFIAAIGIFATGIAGLIEDLRQRQPASRIWSWLAAHALLGALFLAILLPTQSVLHLRPQGINAYLGNGTIHSRGGALKDLVNVLSAIHLSLDGVWPWVLIVPLAIGTALAVRRRGLALLVIAYLPIVFAFGLSIAGTYPIGNGRFCLWLVPGLLPLFAIVVQDLHAWRGSVAGIAALLGILLPILVNLETSDHHSALFPSAWRQSTQASNPPPLQAEQIELERTLLALDTPRSLVFTPFAHRKRIRLDAQLGWLPEDRFPPLAGCPFFAWEGYTPEEAQRCVRALLEGQYGAQQQFDWAWFLNFPQRQHEGALRDSFAKNPCLPLGEPKRVGGFLLLPIDLRALRDPKRTQSCGVSAPN